MAHCLSLFGGSSSLFSPCCLFNLLCLVGFCSTFTYKPKHNFLQLACHNLRWLQTLSNMVFMWLCCKRVFFRCGLVFFMGFVFTPVCFRSITLQDCHTAQLSKVAGIHPIFIQILNHLSFYLAPATMKNSSKTINLPQTSILLLIDIWRISLPCSTYAGPSILSRSSAMLR